MDTTQKALIQADFEKFMRHRMRQGEKLDVEILVRFGASLINFHVGSSGLAESDKEEAARQICDLFNRGLKTKISAPDLKQLVLFMVGDGTIDYQLLRVIF